MTAGTWEDPVLFEAGARVEWPVMPHVRRGTVVHDGGWPLVMVRYDEDYEPGRDTGHEYMHATVARHLLRLVSAVDLLGKLAADADD